MIPKATKLYEKMMSVWTERDDHFLAGLFEVYAKDVLEVQIAERDAHYGISG